MDGAQHEFGDFVDFSNEFGQDALPPQANDAINFQELFYSPLLSNGPASTEVTPFMTPGDHSLPSDFSMPPSYFSPSPAFSPALNPSEVPNFELPKKLSTPSQAGRIRKQPSQRRQKWSGSRRNSTASSVAGSTRHNSSASPNTEDDENATPAPASGAAPGAAVAPVVTPASLMNVQLPKTQHELGSEERLDQALQATLQHDHRRFSSSSQSSAITPAIRPRRFEHSASSSPALAPYASPTIVPSDSDMATLLSQKSNYQHIVDGKYQQLGLQYPERLTSEVTNKKTSHKIAEQERRNRINVAITELGKLVTPDAPMTSKAATVEAAIVHIKDLNEQIRALKSRLGE